MANQSCGDRVVIVTNVAMDTHHRVDPCQTKLTHWPPPLHSTRQAVVATTNQ